MRVFNFKRMMKKGDTRIVGSGRRKPTTEEFIEKVKLVHGNFYDYSKVEYVSWNTPIEIICKEHGSFNQKPSDHLRSSGCKKCSLIIAANKKKHFHKIQKQYTYNTTPPQGSQIIPINKNKYAIVDNEDYERVSHYNWNLTARKYAENAEVGLMHRFIMGLEKGDKRVVDHMFHNELDNRKSRLRVCTHQENLRNFKKNSGSSQYRGVYWCNYYNKWVSKFIYKSKGIHVGYFKNELEAAKAYDIKIKSLNDKFLNLNFPEND